MAPPKLPSKWMRLTGLCTKGIETQAVLDSRLQELEKKIDSECQAMVKEGFAPRLYFMVVGEGNITACIEMAGPLRDEQIVQPAGPAPVILGGQPR